MFFIQACIFLFSVEEVLLACLWQSSIIRSVERAGNMMKKKRNRETCSFFLQPPSPHPALLSFQGLGQNQLFYIPVKP